MKELFPFNNTKEAYKFFTTFLQKHYNIQKVKGKVMKDFLEIEFKYNSLEPCLSVNSFNQSSFAQIELTFSPFVKHGDFISYSLSGREINITNLKKLLKLCKLIDIPICEKCGEHPIEYIENCIKKTTYSADLTGNPFMYRHVKSNFLNSYAPFPLNVNAKCSCGNIWLLKGIISTQQIISISELKSNSLYLWDRNPPKVLTKKDINELFLQPTEYAKLDNEKYLKRRTVVLTKKEIKQLLDAINAGEEDDK